MSTRNTQVSKKQKNVNMQNIKKKEKKDKKQIKNYWLKTRSVK